MAISTNPKPTIYCNFYENTDPESCIKTYFYLSSLISKIKFTRVLYLDRAISHSILKFSEQLM